MQLRNTSALALRGASSISASSSCARRSILSSFSSHYSTSVSRSIARPAVTTLRPVVATSSAQSNSAVFSTPAQIHIRTMASQASKIKVKNPVVELDGDEVCHTFLLRILLSPGHALYLYSSGRRGAGLEFGPSAYPHQSMRIPMLSMSDVDASYAKLDR